MLRALACRPAPAGGQFRHEKSETAKIRQAKSDFAARLGTKYVFSPKTQVRHKPTCRY